MKKILWAGALVVALGALPGIAFAQGADEAQKEVDKQIAKAITDAINSRVSTQVATEAVTSARPNNLWISAGQVSVTTKGAGGFDMDVPTVLGGFDRDVRGKVMTGVSLSYYQGDATLAPSGTTGSTAFEMMGFGVSPYFAFILSPNYFITTKINLGTSYTEFSFRGSGFSAEGESYSFNYGLGGAFNTLFRPRNFVLKGSAKLEWSATSITTDTTTRTTIGGFSSTNFSSTSDSDSQIIYGLEGEAGYLIGSRSYLFAGAAWSDTDQPSSNQITARVGFEQQLGGSAALGIKYETQIGGDDRVDVDSIFLTFRMAF